MFTDRVDAGTLLARKVSSYRGGEGVVLGLARGGMVIGATIASFLELPLDVLVVNKIGAPGNSELAIGAVAPDGVSFIDQALAERVGADENYIKSQITNLNDQIKQKIFLYKKNRKSLSIKGKTVIVVDDGAATGATMFAAMAWLKKKKAGKIVAALPVMPAELAEKLRTNIDDVVYLEAPRIFDAVGQFYEDFREVSDEEVIQLLR